MFRPWRGRMCLLARSPPVEESPRRAGDHALARVSCPIGRLDRDAVTPYSARRHERIRRYEPGSDCYPGARHLVAVPVPAAPSVGSRRPRLLSFTVSTRCRAPHRLTRPPPYGEVTLSADSRWEPLPCVAVSTLSTRHVCNSYLVFKKRALENAFPPTREFELGMTRSTIATPVGATSGFHSPAPLPSGAFSRRPCGPRDPRSRRLLRRRRHRIQLGHAIESRSPKR
jgi:hypothetical protein